MTRWRPLVLAVLLVAPVLLLVTAALWAIWEWERGWETGVLFWIWWPLPALWGVAYWLSSRWGTDILPLPAAAFGVKQHWTPQDHKAFELILERQKTVREIPPDRLVEPQFYLETALDIARETSRHYHPHAKDPFTSLTVLEILAAAQLAADDLEDWFEKYVPGSHLLSVGQWKMLSRAPEWYRTASNVAWAASMFVNPMNIGRFLLSKVALDPATAKLQADLLALFYIAFVRQIGFYVIEMNSGRLRGGAERYRAAMQKLEVHQGSGGSQQTGAPPTRVAAATEEPLEVTIALVGQVKAGKSSLANALLGEQKAASDVLPLTRGTHRYSLNLAGTPDRLVLLDTAGYGEEGASAAQVEETRRAFQMADVVLLVMDARSPAREPDRKLLEAIRDWYQTNVRLRPPSVVGVLTHIDGLSPVMEWSPPYDWTKPVRPKEETIRSAVEYNAREFGHLLAAVVPVCSDVEANRVHGVEEWLLPAVSTLLGEARACSLIRTLHSELDRGKVRRVARQFYHAGRGLIDSYLASVR